MNERNAMRLALMCSVVGLILLFLFSSWAEQSAAPARISELSLDNMGSGVKLCGNLTGMRVNKGHVFMQVDDGTGSMRVVVFNNTASRINQSGSGVFSLKSGDGICASGQLEEYPPGSGELELVAKKVFDIPP